MARFNLASVILSEKTPKCTGCYAKPPTMTFGSQMFLFGGVKKRSALAPKSLGKRMFCRRSPPSWTTAEVKKRRVSARRISSTARPPGRLRFHVGLLARCGLHLRNVRASCDDQAHRPETHREWGVWMKTYGVYREFGYLELVAFIKATSHEEAVRKARSLGYGKEFRIEEEEDE